MWVPRVDAKRPAREPKCFARGSSIGEPVGAEAAAIQLVTRCSSLDEFIERFARFTTETDIVVPAVPQVSVGTSGRFVVCLKDRTVMLEGRCEVAEIRPVAVSAGAPPTPAGFAL